MKNTKLEFSLPVSILKEDNVFIAYTPALDLSTCGDTYEEAKERFSEIVNIFFEEVTKKGTLEDVLLDLGWKKVQSHWNPPVVVSQESQSMTVSV